MLAEHLVGIKLFRPRQCLGLLDAREEAVPRDYRGDRVKGVLLVVARRNQSGTDTGVEMDLLVDGAAVGLEGAGMPLVGSAAISRSNRSTAWSVRLAARSRVTATTVACRRWRS